MFVSKKIQGLNWFLEQQICVCVIHNLTLSSTRLLENVNVLPLIVDNHQLHQVPNVEIINFNPDSNVITEIKLDALIASFKLDSIVFQILILLLYAMKFVGMES